MDNNGVYRAQTLLKPLPIHLFTEIFISTSNTWSRFKLSTSSPNPNHQPLPGHDYCGVTSHSVSEVLKMFKSCAGVVRRVILQIRPNSSSAPPNPRSFGVKFAIPSTNESFPLKEKNAHPNDSLMKFDSAEHKYYYDGRDMEMSVTSLVDGFFTQFNADEVIERMMSGSNWPRKEYIFPNGKEYRAEDIKKKWDSIGQNARNRGTWMHYNIERYLNGLVPNSNIPEMQQFFQFEADFLKPQSITPYRTEWNIAAPEYKLGGTVDYIGTTPAGEYIMMDWKRSKKLPESMNNTFGRKAHYPIDHIDDCEGSKYILQMNIYRYILREYYDIKVSKMILTSFFPTMPKYFASEVPIWEEEAVAVLTTMKGIDSWPDEQDDEMHRYQDDTQSHKFH